MHIVRRLPSLAAVLTLLAAPSPVLEFAGAQATATGWTLHEGLKVRRLSQPRLSYDDQRIVYLVRSAVTVNGRLTSRAILYIANVDGSGERTVLDDTYVPRFAEWSPDGRWLGVVATGPGDSLGASLWLVPANGGTPQRVRDAATDISSLKWSPDGRWLAWTAPVSRTQAQALAEASSRAPRVVGAEFRNEVLWVLPVGDDGVPRGTARPLSADSLTIAVDPVYGGPSFDWSPDSRSIAFTVSPPDPWYGPGNGYYTHWRETQLLLADVSRGSLRRLACCGVLFPSFSPDGRHVAYATHAGRRHSTLGGYDSADTLRVAVLGVEGGTPHLLAATWSGEPWPVGWTVDGSEILVWEPRGMAIRLTALPVSGAPPRDLDAGDSFLGDIALGASRTTVAFTRQTLTTPVEVHVARLGQFAPTRVSRVNADLPSHPLPKFDVLRWTSADGATIEGLLLHPVGAPPGYRPPLVVSVRSGGDAYANTFLGTSLWAGGSSEAYRAGTALAFRGFAVLHVNSRGGDLPGYGRDAAIPNTQPGRKSFADVMSGVDHVIALGAADSTRIGIVGASNGGMVAAWAITQTTRFKAAAIVYGVTDVFSLAATTGSFRLDFGVEPWEDPSRYVAASPLAHAGRVQTPTLFLHGDRDEYVPVGQAYALYGALLHRRVPTSMVVYPGLGHGGFPLDMGLDVHERIIAWMERYLQ